MASVSQVTEAVFTSRFEDQTTAGATAAARSLDSLGNAVEAVDERLTRTTKTAATWVRQNDLVTQAADRLARAERDAERAQKALAEEFLAGGARAEAAARAMEGLNAKVETAKSRVEALRQAHADSRKDMDGVSEAAGLLSQRMDALATASQRASAAQASYNQMLGVRVSDADAYARRAADIAAYGTELDRLRAKFNPLYAASKQYEAVLEEIAQAERMGAITSREAQLAHERATAAFAAANAPLRGVATASGTARDAVKLQAHEWTNLSYQLQDFVVQVGSGQGVFRPLLQQAPQATGAVGGVSRAVQLVTQFFTPFRLAMVAATAASATVALSYNSQEAALATMQTRLRGVTADYEAMGRRAEAAAKAAVLVTPGLSIETARSAQIAFARAAPRGSGLDFGALTAQAADFAATMGTDVSAAVDRFAAAMRDPVALVDDLRSQGFPGMNEQLRLTTQRMVEGGQRGDAFALVIGRISEQTKGAAEAGLSPFGGAMDALSRRLKSLGQEIGDFLAEPGRQFAEWLTKRLGKTSEGGVFDPSLGSTTGIGRLTGWEPWGGSRPPGYSAANEMVREEPIRNAISAASAATGVDAEILARIYSLGERSRPNADGSWPVSPKGAQGPFQFLPGTFAEVAQRYGIQGTPTDPNAAALAAAYYFRENYQKFGDVDLTLGAYNAGPRRMEQVLAGQAALPNETAQYIRRAGAGYNGTPLGAPAQASPSQPVPVVLVNRPNGFDASGADASSMARRDQSAQTVDRALSMARGAAPVPGQDGTLAVQRAGLEEAIALAERAKQATAGNAEVQDRLTAAQERWRATLDGLKGPQEEVLRGLSRAAQSANEYDPAQRAVNEAIREYEDRMRAAGQIPTDEGRSQVRAQKLKELGAAYVGASRDAQRSIQGQDRLAEAWGQGREAVQRLAAEEKAREVVRASGIQGDEAQRAKVRELADEYERLTEKQADNALRASNDTAQRNLDYLEKERELVGATADERERELAAYRARQNATASGAKDEGEIAKAEQLARQTVDTNRQITQMRNSWDEVARVGEQAFDRIGGAITEAFANGSLKAVDFKNVAKAALSEVLQAALRLSVINPVLNGLFGGTRGTLGGIGAVMSGGGGDLAITNDSGGIVGYVQQGAQAYSAYSKLSGINPTSYINASTPINTGFSWLDGALNTPVGGAYSGINAGGAVTNSAGYGSMAQNAIDAGGSPVAAGAGWGTYGGYAMGVAGIAGGLYSAYTGVQRGGVGGYTQAAGGAATAGLSAAAMYGMSVPVYGWIAAAALLVLGALLPGQKPSDRTGTATYYTNDPSNPVVGGLNGDRFSQENRDQALAIGGQLLAVAQKVADVTSVPNNRVETAYRVAVGARDGLNVYFGEDKLHGSMDEEGVTAVTRAFVQRILLQAAEQTTDPNIRSVINRSGVDDSDKTLANLSWYNNDYKNMIAASQTPVPAFVQQINALVAPIEEAKTKARELGIAEDDLNAVRATAVQTLIDQRSATLAAITASDTQRQAAASGVSEIVLRLQNFNTAAQAEVRALDDQLRDLDIQPEARGTFTADRWRTLDAEYQALTRQRDMAVTANSNSLWDRFQAASGNGETLEGALWDYDRHALAEWTQAAADGITDLTLLQRVQTEERLAIERRFAQEATALDAQRREQAEQSVVSTLGGITQFVQSLQFGDASSLSPDAQLRLANSQFDILSTRALSGDYDAVTQITGAAGNLLNAGRDVYASSPGYADLERRVVGVLEGIANISTDTLTNSSMASIAQNLGDRLLSANNDLKSEIRLMRKAIEGILPP
jgi:hypothetical protein